MLTEEQILLIRYLAASKMEKVDILLIVGKLSEEKATMEMLEYIAENHPLSQAQLFSTALKISEKYPIEINEEEDE